MERITVEVTKLPATRRNAQLYEGDTVQRALVEAFGSEDYSKYTIAVNGNPAELNQGLFNGDVIVISTKIKGNK